MTMAFAQSVFSFDLDFLHEPSNNDVVCGLLQNQNEVLDKKAIATENGNGVSQFCTSQPQSKQSAKNKKGEKGLSYLKRKIIQTSDLIEQFHARGDQISKYEKNLISVKSKCQEAYIERDIDRQKCENLEKECEKLRNLNRDLEQKDRENDTKQLAAQSYTRQLQQLIKERDVQLDAVRVEKHLDKTAIKTLQKHVRFFKKHRDCLITRLSNVADVVFTRRILTKKEKIVLEKYMRIKRQRMAEGIEKKCNEELNSGSEADDFDVDSLSDTEDFTEVINEKVHSPAQLQTQEPDSNTYSNDDSDATSEVISVDSGRGSSDRGNDKNLHSSECNIDKQRYHLNDRLKEKQTDATTSPIKIQHSVDKATSPIMFDLNCPCPRDNKKTQTAKSINTTPVKTINRAICNNGTPKIIVTNHEFIDGIEPLSGRTEQSCLELNNSKNFVNDNTDDCEVEMILNTMKLSDKPVTPIPSTPARSTGVKSITTHEYANERLEVTKEAESHAKLNSTLQGIVKDIMDVKCMIKKISDTVCINKDPVMLGNEQSTDNISLQDENNMPVVIEIQDAMHNPDQETISEIPQENEGTQNQLSCEDIVLPNNVSKKKQFEEVLVSDAVEINAHFENIVENETVNTVECVGKEEKRTSRAKKLTQLEKLRRNLIPKSKLDAVEINAHSENIVENETVNTVECVGKEEKRTSRAKKLTQLEKLRRNLIPKSKIKKADLLPPRKLRSRINPAVITNNIKKNNSNIAASLNDKDVYEKAVRVMAELKSQQKSTTRNILYKRKQHTSGDLLNINYITPRTTIAGDSGTTNDTSQKIISTDRVCDKNSSLDQSVIDKTYANEVSSEKKTVKSTAGKTDDDNRRKSFSNIDSVLSKSRKKYPSLSLDKDIIVVLTRPEFDIRFKATDKNIENKLETSALPCDTRKRFKRAFPDKQENVHNSRILRSMEHNNNRKKCDINTQCLESHKKYASPNHDLSDSPGNLISYNDLDLFNDKPPPKKQKIQNISANSIDSPQESVLCKTIDKYGVSTMKNNSKKVPESVVNTIHKSIEDNIAHVIELPQTEAKEAMNRMIEEMKKWKLKQFLAGLMNYLMDPSRKIELFNKMNVPPAPPMTKSEQVVLYMVTRISWSNNIDVVNAVLNQIEYTLFRLNQTPDLEVVESMSHLYAVLCRYINAKSRLRLFIIDAMYCIQFKAVPLIKQCVEVWMHILPLAHMGSAKSPLVTCLVYLLHFYKCEDKFNRVQEIRNILRKKYFFHITDWNESKILEMFKNAILELTDNPAERKMLRLALIILAKRHGPKWCQSKIIKSMLMPIIVNENIPQKTKAFCVSMLGPLFKPYPVEMKVHCEIGVNQLIDMLDTNPTPLVEEAVYKSLICMSKHNQNRIIQALLLWQPKEISLDMESMLQDYVKEKPVRVWKSILSQISLVK